MFCICCFCMSRCHHALEQEKIHTRTRYSWRDTNWFFHEFHESRFRPRMHFKHLMRQPNLRPYGWNFLPSLTLWFLHESNVCKSAKQAFRLGLLSPGDLISRSAKLKTPCQNSCPQGRGRDALYIYLYTSLSARRPSATVEIAACTIAALYPWTKWVYVLPF